MATKLSMATINSMATKVPMATIVSMATKVHWQQKLHSQFWLIFNMGLFPTKQL